MKLSSIRKPRTRFNATAVEYALIAAGISLAIITVVNGLGTNLNNKGGHPTSVAPATVNK